jgi:hypothetical protein
MEGFRARLDEINALADRSAGFVWDLKAFLFRIVKVMLSIVFGVRWQYNGTGNREWLFQLPNNLEIAGSSFARPPLRKPLLK